MDTDKDIRESPRDPWLAFRGRIEVDFEVNGETYFLSLAEDERQWLLFVEGERGTRPLSVYDDAPEFKSFAVVFEDKKKHRIPN